MNSADPAKKFLVQMEELMDRLLENAEKLKKLSSGSIVPEELEALQRTQEALVAELCEQDADLRKMCVNGKQPEEYPSWGRMQKKLEAFSVLNDLFIENLSVRKGLIQFEMQDVKKTRQSMNKMKGRYGGKGSDKKQRYM